MAQARANESLNTGTEEVACEKAYTNLKKVVFGKGKRYRMEDKE